MIQVYHNTRCSKSRECILFLEESGKPYEIIEYLKDVPTFEELKAVIKKLNITPIQLVRKKEPLWLERFEGKKLSGDRLIRVMVANPILIERPIVINGDRAVIARPLEKASEII